MRVKYKNPPINEVVVGVYLRSPLVALRAEHIGLFWSGLKSDFPVSQQAPPLAEFQIPGENEIFPLPRFWFISEDDSLLLQVQRNALLFNWRKRGDIYPHYENIKEKFDRYFSEFQSFVQSEFAGNSIEVETCELAYINTIENKPYFSSVQDMPKVLPGISPPRLSTGENTHFNVMYNFSRDADRSLRITVQNRRNNDTNNDVLYFDIRALGQPKGNGPEFLNSWFDSAHDDIGQTFRDLTSPVIQNEYWQPEG